MDIIVHPKAHDGPTLDDPLLQNLERYWKTLRHAQKLPARSDLNPSQIDGVLPYAFILQRVAPGVARFRVAGQKLHELIKIDARGMPFSTLFQTSERENIKSLIEAAFEEPAIIGLPLISPAAVFQPAMQASMLLLPMRDDKGQTSRILGAIVTDPHTSQRPRRFVINQAGSMRHESLGIKLATTRLMPHDPEPSERPDTSLRPALRLVVNNG